MPRIYSVTHAEISLYGSQVHQSPKSQHKLSPFYSAVGPVAVPSDKAEYFRSIYQISHCPKSHRIAAVALLHDGISHVLGINAFFCLYTL